MRSASPATVYDLAVSEVAPTPFVPADRASNGVSVAM